MLVAARRPSVSQDETLGPILETTLGQAAPTIAGACFYQRVRKPPDLSALYASIARAEKLRDRPLEPDEVRGVSPLIMLVDDRGSRAIWALVSELSRRDPELYNEFIDEHDLYDQIFETAVDLRPPAYEQLTLEIRQRLARPARWLVAVPLTNILVPDGFALIEKDMAAVASSVQDPEWTPGSNTDPQRDPLAMFHGLQDRIDVGVRWMDGIRHRKRLDTRMTAKLILTESGTERAAIARAVTRTRLAIAIWCLLDPPDHTMVWPSFGEWLPGPYLQAGIVHKPYEPGAWAGATSASGRSLSEYREYTLTTNPLKLSAPFSMMRLAETMVAPRAVLSGAWQLYLAERQPSGLERTDQLVHLHTAIDALCDVGLGPQDHDTEKRWTAIAERFQVWTALGNTYRLSDIEGARRLGRDLRDITQHGSDDVLINLGYPEDAVRQVQGKRELTGQQLALARASFTLPILRHGVRTVARGLVTDGLAHGWDDDRFVSLFEPGGSTVANS